MKEYHVYVDSADETYNTDYLLVAGKTYDERIAVIMEVYKIGEVEACERFIEQDANVLHTDNDFYNLGVS